MDGCCFNNLTNYQSSGAEQAIRALVWIYMTNSASLGPTITNPYKLQGGRGDLSELYSPMKQFHHCAKDRIERNRHMDCLIAV